MYFVCMFFSQLLCAPALVGESIQMYIKKLGKIKRKKGNKNFFTILKFKKLKKEAKNKKIKKKNKPGLEGSRTPTPINS